MKYVLSALAALCFLPVVALAQQGGGAPNNPNAPNTPSTRPATGQRPVGANPGANTGQTRPTNRPAVGERPVGGPPAADNNRPNRPSARPPQHRPRPPSSVHRPPHRPGVWHRPRAHQWYWRGRWVHRIRGPRFVFPRGYRYRHWGFGQRLPVVFLAAPFFFDDFLSLSLQPPPPGFRWVRFGPDLFLVDMRTGEIVDAAYGVFY